MLANEIKELLKRFNTEPLGVGKMKDDNITYYMEDLRFDNDRIGWLITQDYDDAKPLQDAIWNFRARNKLHNLGMIENTDFSSRKEVYEYLLINSYIDDIEDLSIMDGSEPLKLSFFKPTALSIHSMRFGRFSPLSIDDAGIHVIVKFIAEVNGERQTGTAIVDMEDNSVIYDIKVANENQLELAVLYKIREIGKAIYGDKNEG